MPRFIGKDGEQNVEHDEYEEFDELEGEDGEAASEEYHDDPIVVEKKDHSRLVRGFGAFVILIVSASYYLSTSIGGRITLNSGTNPIIFGQGSSQTVACSGDRPLTVEPTKEFFNSAGGGGYYLKALTVSDIPESCVGSDFTIKAYGAVSNTPLELLPLCTNSSRVVVSYAESPIFAASEGDSAISVSGSYVYKWTEHIVAGGAKNWSSIASSYDGIKLVASVSGGYIYTSTDSGDSWTEQTGAGLRNWKAVTSSSDGSKLAAAVSGGYVYTSQDSGNSWTELTGIGSSNWSSLSSSADGTKLLATVNLGYPSTFSNLGTNYALKGIDGTARAWTSSGMSADGMIMLVGREKAVWGSSNGNDFGVRSSGNNATHGAVIAVSSNGNIAVSGASALWQSVNSGISWGQVLSFGVVKAVAASATGKYLFAAKSNDSIMTSTNYGVTWESLNGSGSRNWTSIATSNDGAKIAAVASTGNIYTVERTSSFTATFTNPIAATSSIEKLVMTTNVSVEQESKVNRTWTERTSVGTKDWTSIATSCSGDKLAAVATNDYIYTSINSGLDWITHDSLGRQNWASIASSKDGTVLVAAINPGLIYRSTNSGTDWLPVTSAGSKEWKSIAMSANGMTIAAAESNGGIWVSTNGGDDWVRTFTGDASWTSVAVTSDGSRGFATSNTGFYRATNLLASSVVWDSNLASLWTAVASSIDGEKVAASSTYHKRFYIWTSSNYGDSMITQGTTNGWRVVSLASSEDGTRLAAVRSGSPIQISINSGVTWVEQSSAGSRSWTSVASSGDGAKIVAVANNGSIWTSDLS